jgi:hypothetical protein
MVNVMERDSFDAYLAHSLKQELLISFPPAGGKVKLLSQASTWIAGEWASWPLRSRRSQNLYRVHVYRGTGLSDQVDCLMASYTLEFRMLNQQHLFA